MKRPLFAEQNHDRRLITCLLLSLSLSLRRRRLFVVRRETSNDARNQDSWHIHVTIDGFCLPVAGSNVMKITEIIIFIVLFLWHS